MLNALNLILRLLLIPLIKELIISYTEKKRRRDELEQAKKYAQDGGTDNADRLP